MMIIETFDKVTKEEIELEKIFLVEKLQVHDDVEKHINWLGLLTS